MWCPKCKIEYRKGISVCTDCGSALVERNGEYGVDICEINDEATADEIVEFLTYSGIEGVEKEASEDSIGFKITVPSKAERKAEKLFHGYLIAKEEEKEQAETASMENNISEMEDDTVSTHSPKAENDLSEKNPEESELFSDEVEDTVELLHSSSKGEYVKKSEKYRDMKFSGITFIIFGILGGLYLVLCKLEIIPIEYNIFVFCVIAALFAAFFISGIVSIVKSQKIRRMIPAEEEKTKAVKTWLDENLTKEMVEKWSDSNVSDGENDLLVTAHIRTILMKEYPDESEAYLEMIADEYYEEHFFNEMES